MGREELEVEAEGMAQQQQDDISFALLYPKDRDLKPLQV